MAPPAPITSFQHPLYRFNLPDWQTWRYIMEGGEQFIRAYLAKYSTREREADFIKRREFTPNQAYAKSAILDVKNAVFQRMVDITRKGGTENYNNAIVGMRGGVDRRGASMNNFLGTRVLPELLSMGQVGVYVDNLPIEGETLADVQNTVPYLYVYRVEDILDWKCSLPESNSDFQAILLRDWCIDYQQLFAGVSLPKNQFERFRLVWIGEDGFVRYQFFNDAGQPIMPNGDPAFSEEGIVLQGMTRIPFVLFDIGDSMLRDISNHQIALMNLASSAVAYALKSNYPFITMQDDGRAIGAHLKSDVMDDGTATSGGQQARQKVVQTGDMDGVTYPLNADRPDFIHPSAEPLRANLELQASLRDDIRRIINLSVTALGTSRASGEARNFDNQGLEAGLSYIGMVLEKGEKQIADHWASYEGNDTRDTVQIKYPERYNLKTTEERLDEAAKLTKLMFDIPGRKIKQELSKDAVLALLGDRVNPATLEAIFNEIETVRYSTSNPDVVELAKDKNLASDITLSDQLGYVGSIEVPLAHEDHEERVERIAKAQGINGDPNPAARGESDMDGNPGDSASEERAETRDNTTNESTEDPVRGEGEDTDN